MMAPVCSDFRVTCCLLGFVQSSYAIPVHLQYTSRSPDRLSLTLETVHV
jgi:hypothetical protein